MKIDFYSSKWRILGVIESDDRYHIHLKKFFIWIIFLIESRSKIGSISNFLLYLLAPIDSISNKHFIIYFR